jgi:hypothetical protein
MTKLVAVILTAWNWPPLGATPLASVSFWVSHTKGTPEYPELGIVTVVTPEEPAGTLAIPNSSTHWDRCG